MGTSAGAAHVSSYVFFEDFQLKEGDGVAGAILFSGPTYDTSRLDLQRDTVYYGKDESKYPAMSAIKHLDGRKIPLFIVIAELDMPSIHYQNRVLIDALYERDKASANHETAYRPQSHFRGNPLQHKRRVDRP